MIQIEMFCGGVFQTNGYLVTLDGGEKRYLFDAPDRIADWLGQNEIDSLDGLILTHQHHDHVIGAGAVQAKFGCPTWAHSEPFRWRKSAKARRERIPTVPHSRSLARQRVFSPSG